MRGDVSLCWMYCSCCGMKHECWRLALLRGCGWEEKKRSGGDQMCPEIVSYLTTNEQENKRRNELCFWTNIGHIVFVVPPIHIWRERFIAYVLHACHFSLALLNSTLNNHDIRYQARRHLHCDLLYIGFRCQYRLS